MLDTQELSYTLLIVYFLAVVCVSLRMRTKSTDKDKGFAIGNREVGFWPTAASLVASLRDGGGITLWVVVGASLAYEFYWIVVGAVVGYFIHTLHMPVLRKLAKKHNLVTLSDFTEKMAGPNTTMIFSLIAAFVAVLYTAVQLYVSGQVLSVLTGEPLAWGVILCAFLVGFYLMLGGYKALVTTDLLQWGTMSVILVAPFFYYTIPSSDIFLSGFLKTSAAPTSFAFFVLIVLYLYATPDMWQRIFSVRSDKEGKNAFLAAIPLFIAITFGISVFGAYLGSFHSDVTSENVFSYLFSGTLFNPMITALAGVAFISITMSTLDTQSYVFTSTVTKNIMKIDNKKSHDRYVRWNRMLTMALMIVMCVVALSINDFIKFLFDSVFIVAVTAPALLYIYLKRDTKNKCSDNQIAMALGTGSVLYLGMFFGGYFPALIYNLIPVCVTGLMLLTFHHMFVDDK